MSQLLPKGFVLKSPRYKYKLVRQLGQGSFGITYLADIDIEATLTLHTPIGDNTQTYRRPYPVCIKEFFMKDFTTRAEDGNAVVQSNPELVESYSVQFLKEAQHLSKLSHQGIIKVIEVFQANSTAYYAMEYIEGGSLDDYIKKNGPLPEKESIEILKDIALSIGYMHQHHMLHLDLKPKNIMRRLNGHMVLIDYGLSKTFNDNGDPETSANIGQGTVGYAPIEQASYKPGMGFPTTMDIYALGGVLYKMLFNQSPPSASQILEYGYPVQKLDERNASPMLRKLATTLMNPYRQQRPQNIPQVLTQLDTMLSAFSNQKEDTPATPVTPVMPNVKQQQDVRYNVSQKPVSAQPSKQQPQSDDPDIIIVEDDAPQPSRQSNSQVYEVIVVE